MGARRVATGRIVTVLGVVLLGAGAAWAIGFELGQTKQQLKLEYDVAAADTGTGRVIVTLSIASAGRLKPLTSVDLLIPSRDGTGYVDLSLPVATRDERGKQVARVEMKRELAERAEFQLRTSTLDGKQMPLTWYYHRIPLAEHLPSRP